MYQNRLYFKDNKFKIMQIADVQENYPVSSDTIKLINLAIEREKPDLAVFTGDQIYGISPCYHLKNGEERVRSVIEAIVAPLENAGVPFAVTFGNHDCQCGITNQQQAQIYYEFSHCVKGDCFASNDLGSSFIPVFDSSNKQKLIICLIDSGTQSPTGEYYPVSEAQLNCFCDKREQNYKQNGEYLPTLVFQHIPVPEFYDVLNRAKRFEKGSVEAFRVRKNEFYKLPQEITHDGGFMFESPAVPDINSGEFDRLKEKGNVLAIIVGHDHNNSFVAQKDGIKLIYTQCAGFNVYGPHLKRGVRIIEFNADSPNTFLTHTLTYAELTNDKLCSPLKEFTLTHIPTSMEQVKRLAIIAAAGGTIAGACCLKTYINHRNKTK